jgi:ribosomal protein L34E
VYAKSSPPEIYHLLTKDQDQTVCGQAVVPIIIDRPAQTSALHLTTERPAGGKLCEDCAKQKDKD